MDIRNKAWDSKFFRRPISELVVDGVFDVNQAKAIVEAADLEGIWGIEAQLLVQQTLEIRVLEALGFYLVDSKVRFLTSVDLCRLEKVLPPYGRVRLARTNDLDQIYRLTKECFVDNTEFVSRYKAPWLFTYDEASNYYKEWNLECMSEYSDLFVVWELEGKVLGYSSFKPIGRDSSQDVYKGVLAAVDLAHRGRKALNFMQNYVFHQIGKQTFIVDNTTQLANVVALRNHMAAGKTLSDIHLVFYRVNDDNLKTL
ncbi:MAG: hypothetical protein EA369_02280 [Bradymonadales bacterium]|nr:MAG: hypothetical protein EA369_02280 [Bradymonadales bacterium]